MGTDSHEDHGDDEDGDEIVPSAAASRPVFFFDVDNCVSSLFLISSGWISRLI